MLLTEKCFQKTNDSDHNGVLVVYVFLIAYKTHVSKSTPHTHVFGLQTGIPDCE